MNAVEQIISDADVKTSSNSTPSIRKAFAGTFAGEGKVLSPQLRFRWCPAGQFTMGTPGATDSESPVEVTLSQGFWLAETVVTQRQWQALMGTIPWLGKEDVSECEDSPAVYIRHQDAFSYCEMLTTIERKAGRLPSAWTFALPTEAQWEYSCRSGAITRFSFGDEGNQLDEYGWYTRRGWLNRFGWFSKFGWISQAKSANPVGLKKPNGWGLKDMHGNVWEWCSDWYGEKLLGGRDPVGPASGERRVNRGGSWSGLAEFCRAADRGSYSPDGRTDDLGFRVAIVPSSE